MLYIYKYIYQYLYIYVCVCACVCVSFVSLDVVCNELSDGVRYVDVYEFVNVFMYIQCQKPCLYQVLQRLFVQMVCLLQ